MPAELPDLGQLKMWLADLGSWGPAAVIVAMIVAILISPLPSAPIALSAGAVYGHFWGALYVLAGSEIGALGAFLLARFLGFEALQARFGAALNQGLFGSQNALMWTVFISRLMPFISFDIVSYAAGLTRLTLWRFALATLAGIVPASFLLAHFGSELVSEEPKQIMIAVLAIGLIASLPLLVRSFSSRNQD
ncbi:MAG: TVP38/TMEM64 family protein [Geminicoccales bacterium]